MDILERLRQALANRYAVEHELGRGGMAVVYLGRDLRLGRKVAIKVFASDHASGDGLGRFLREIQVAAQLQHPSILPVHDTGEAEGLVYYVMPYVAGATLRERLEREGALPIAEAVRIAREVALALDHAHRSGIVHRDIKPENILLADNMAVVADFGIARALEQGGRGLTETGMAIGTPNYMSPEQALANPIIDGRADIYALGCVLYEMLAGAPPFSGPTAQAVMARHTADMVPPLRTVRPEVPEALESAVVKALAKLPADRWSTGREFADALASLSIERRPGTTAATAFPWARAGLAAALVVILAAGAWLIPSRMRAAGAEGRSDSASPSLAVASFSLIGDTGAAYIAQGITEAVGSALIRVEGLRIPAGGTTLAQRVGDPVEVGRQLNVAYVLTGTVQVANREIRVIPRLVRVADGTNAWSEQYRGLLVDIFDMQDSISRRVVDALRIELAPASRDAIRASGTRDPEAYNLYMLGRFFYERADPQALRQAVDYYKAAARRDSSYADPLVALVRTYELLENVAPGAYRPTGPSPRELLSRAIALDSANGEAHELLAGWRWGACDTAGALAEVEAALRFSPQSAETHRNASQYLLAMGRPHEGVQLARRAAELSPTSSWMLANAAYAHLHLGEADSARGFMQRAMSLDSTSWINLAVLGITLAYDGQLDSGIVFLERSRQRGGEGHAITAASLGWAYGLAGRRTDALRIARLLEERVRRREANLYSLAIALAGLGEIDAVLAVLGRQHEAGVYDASGPSEPMLEPFREDPRYRALSARRACTAR